MAHDPDVLRGLLARAALYSHILKTMRAGIPRIDPKTAEAVAQTIALKVRLAILNQDADEPFYQFREIDEGQDWQYCSKAVYDSFAHDPHMDTREVPASCVRPRAQIGTSDAS